MPRTKRLTGTVRSLSDKGFGFLQGEDGTEYFFHRSSAPEFHLLVAGATVTFEPTAGPKGPRAEQVERVG